MGRVRQVRGPGGPRPLECGPLSEPVGGMLALSLPGPPTLSSRAALVPTGRSEGSLCVARGATEICSPST